MTAQLAGVAEAEIFTNVCDAPIASGDPPEGSLPLPPRNAELRASAFVFVANKNNAAPTDEIRERRVIL